MDYATTVILVTYLWTQCLTSYHKLLDKMRLIVINTLSIRHTVDGKTDVVNI